MRFGIAMLVVYQTAMASPLGTHGEKLVYERHNWEEDLAAELHNHENKYKAPKPPKQKKNKKYKGYGMPSTGPYSGSPMMSASQMPPMMGAAQMSPSMGS